MAKPYTVYLNGGGSITVNASDPEAAKANVNDPAGITGVVQAGGHQNNPSGGSNDYSAGQTPQSLDPQSGNTSTPGTTPMPAAGTPAAAMGANMTNAPQTAAAQSQGVIPTTFTSGMGDTSKQTTDANGRPTASGPTVDAEFQYGMRPGEAFTDWAKRAFMQGTADFGPTNMNPYAAQNPAALDPYQTWFQNRYGTSAGMNDLVAKTLAGGPSGGQGDFNTGGAGLKNDISGMMGQNQFGPTNSGQAESNISGITNLVDNNSGLGGRSAMLDEMRQNPSLANQMVLAQYSNIGGPLMAAMSRRLQNMSSQYQATPTSQLGTNATGGVASYWDMIQKAIQAGRS